MTSYIWNETMYFFRWHYYWFEDELSDLQHVYDVVYGVIYDVVYDVV